MAPITADTVADVARLHIAAFPEAESTLLGRRYVVAFVDWFRRQPDAIALAAQAGDVLCGYVVGSPVERVARLYRQLLPTAVLSLVTNSRAVLNADIRTMAVAQLGLLLCRPPRAAWAPPALPRPTMILNAIAVLPPWQSCGVGEGLLQAFESEARARATRSLRLSVLRHNLSARRLYERHGWEAGGAVSEKRMYYTRLLRDGG